MSAQLAEPRTFMITNSAISSSEMDDHNATLTTLTTTVDHTLQTELLRTTSTENIADIVVDQTNNNNISNASNTTPNPNSLLDDAETATAISMIPEALSAQEGEFHFITAENFDDVIAQEEVAVIRVVMPMEGSDASSNDANDNITTLSTIKNNDDLAQQVVNGQVALVQGIDGENTSPQFITVTVSAQDAGQNYQVQYVDTDIYHSNSSQTQMAYPFCAVGDYQTNGQSYYTTTATGNYTSSGSLNTPNTHAASAALSYLVPVDDNLLLTSSSQSHSRDSPNSLNEVAYLHEAHGTPQPNASMATIANSIGCDGGDGGMSSGANNVCSGGDTTPENDQTQLSNNTTNKIASATIKWLSRNYETADGVSLPRSTLYNHYIQHCNENKIEPVNAASFGKLIRSVFSGLRTRRLGTRGNSKYHYYGIRIKPDSPLNHMMEEKDSFILQAATSSGGVGKTAAGGNPIFQMSGGSLQDNRIGPSRGGIHVSRTSKKHYFKPVSYETCAQFLGNGSAAIPPFPPIQLDNTFGSELTNEDVDLFRSMYREHCENFLDAILNLEFHTIEFLWREFWRDSSIDNSSLGDDCVGTSEEKFLSKTKLHLLCHCTAVQRFVQEVDYQFYQNLVEIIVPDVLRSIPNALTQAIRNFSKNMEAWLCESMLGVPERMLHIKSVAVSAFCQTLRRYTSLNHLAQAARAVLQNSTQCAQMLHDLNRVDFHIVQEQAAWVCQCDPIVVQRLENGFKAALQQQSTLEQWATWLQLVVDSALQDYHGKPSFEKACRQFLLKWSFYSSMVIRDLTLRSAPSFGSFHLIRLLYDEYMLYLVEHKIAEVQQKTTIAVVCDHVKRDAESEFDYQVEFIASESTGSEQASKRSKQE